MRARVWCSDLTGLAEVQDPTDWCFGSLTASEIARALRFRVPEDRRRFAVARSMLRQLLGRELGVAPLTVALTANSWGKPCLEGSAGEALQFNVAHSGERVLVALSWEGAIGVDVELKRAIPDLEALVTQYFAPGEVAALRGLDDASRLEAFYACWTRKEALLKARGTGLSEPLDAFEVSVDREPIVRLRWRVRPAPPGDWCIRSIDVGPMYTAAVAGEGRCMAIDLEAFQWPPDSR